MTFIHLQCALNLWVEVVYYFRVCDGKSWGRRESIAAAVEEIIPCLCLKQKLIQLLWFNRITKEKKIFREGEGMCIIHRNAMAQYLLSLDRKKAQSDRMLWLSPLWFQKKLPTLQIFYFCFSSWTAILSVLKANPEALKWKPLINSFLTMLVPSLNIHHGNFVAGRPIILTKSSTSSGYVR